MKSSRRSLQLLGCACRPSAIAQRAICDRPFTCATQELLELNQAVADYVKATAAFEVGKLAITKFLYTGLVAAVALPLALLTATSLLDTPWAVAMERAMKVCVPFQCSA